MARVVWDAAAALTDADRLFLELHRGGPGHRELADAAGGDHRTTCTRMVPGAASPGAGDRGPDGLGQRRHPLRRLAGELGAAGVAVFDRRP